MLFLLFASHNARDLFRMHFSEPKLKLINYRAEELCRFLSLFIIRVGINVYGLICNVN